MSVAFTPGPWHVEPQQDDASWEICTEKRGAWIMVLRSTAEATEDERAEDLANAQLMAAAPDLLATLTQLCFVIRTGGDVLKACEGAEALISKMMGGAS